MFPLPTLNVLLLRASLWVSLALVFLDIVLVRAQGSLFRFTLIQQFLLHIKTRSNPWLLPDKHTPKTALKLPFIMGTSTCLNHEILSGWNIQNVDLVHTQHLAVESRSPGNVLDGRMHFNANVHFEIGCYLDHSKGRHTEKGLKMVA